MLKSHSKSLLIVGLSVSVIAISSAATLIRLAEAPPLAIATYRMIISGVIFLIVSLFLKRGMSFLPHLRSVLTAAFFLSAHFALWITSLSSTSIASSLALVTMNPIFIAIGAHVFLKEKLSTSLLIGTAISIGGCVLLFLGDGFGNTGSINGNIMALLGAMAMSGYMLAGRKSRARMNLISYVTGVYLISGLLLLGVSISTGVKLWGYAPKTYGVLFLLALLPQVIGHSLINWALKYLHASYLAAIILLEPLIGSLIAYLALNETIPIWTALGGSLILIGVACSFFYMNFSQ